MQYDITQIFGLQLCAIQRRNEVSFILYISSVLQPIKPIIINQISVSTESSETEMIANNQIPFNSKKLNSKEAALEMSKQLVRAAVI